MTKMSKLKELIQQYCPDGVEYKNLGVAVSIERGKRLVRGQLSNDCGYPVFQNSMTPLGYHTDYNYPENTAFIIGAGAAGEIGFSSVKFWAADDCYPMVCRENISSRYLYHALLRIQPQIKSRVRKASIPRLSRASIEQFEIPVPPLPVQREIVRILDKFTALTAELTAELTARKKQYEFYRDKLLTISNEQVAMCNLGNICESIADGDHMPPPKADTGIPFITISNITEQNKIDFSNTMFVPHAYYDALAEKRKPQKGDVLYTVVGSYGIPVCIEEDSEFVFQRHIAILRPKKQIVKPRYMFHAMQSSAFKAQADKTAKGVAQKTIGLAALAAMKLPVPSLDVQSRIVNVLDNFDAICSDLKIGLPAEIEARKKQYEFYRDALLTYAATGIIIQTDRQTDRLKV